MASVRNFNRNVKLFRPLLSVGKAQLVSVCDANRIEFVRDPSNENPDFARPRLRRAGAVLAEEGLTAERLAGTAMRIARARQALDILAGRLWDSSLKLKETDRIVLSFSKLEAEPEDLRLRVLLRAAAMLHPDAGYGPRLERIEALAARLFAPEGCPGATLAGIVFRSLPRRDELVLELEAARARPANISKGA
jgi:tRNA(Ile)-lysidine synthase